MARRLASTVYVQSPDGEHLAFGPESTDLPSWLSKVVSNAKAWEGGESSAADVDVDVAAPLSEPEPAVEAGGEKPAGNASEAEWRAYALANGKSEADLADLGRNEIRDLFA